MKRLEVRGRKRKVRQWIKRIYMLMINILNILFRWNKISTQHIVVMMTFEADVLPIIKGLSQQGYRVTVIGKGIHQETIEQIHHCTFIPAGNKHIIHHIKALSTAKVVVIDTYYLLLGAYRKKDGQKIIQTWHAAGALKHFGLTDHQVDHTNKVQVQQYRNVYQATDLYLIGGPPMAECFKAAFDIQSTQLCTTGLPRLVPYCQLNILEKQDQLKQQHGITKKLAIYVPTYREYNQRNRMIGVAQFESAVPGYTLINKLHPAVAEPSQTTLDTQTLMLMADLIITDYSSLAIEASLLNKPSVFYVYDETLYEAERGLNNYYYDIPSQYKAYDEASLIRLIQQQEETLEPLFHNWHQYNTKDSLIQVLALINKEASQ